MPPPPFRFALPPSTGLDGLSAAAGALGGYLEASLGGPADVTVSQTYEVLTRNLLSGAVDAAWAPPFVCAKAEPEGIHVLLQAIRRGQTSYASAFVCRKEDALPLTGLRGKRVAWVDPWSVAGYLLPAAFLKARGLAPDATFSQQMFAGSYREALAAVLASEADVACVHCLPERGETFQEGIAAHLEKGAESFALVDVTDAVPSDGVVLRPEKSALGPALQRAFVDLPKAKMGARLLAEIFHADGFAKAEKSAYRALYHIAPR